MIRKIAIVGGALFAVASIAQAQPRPYAPGPASGGGMRGPEYVKTAGASDLFEITEAKVALTRTHNPRIRQIATMMVRDHTKSTNMVKAAAMRVMGHAPPPPMLMPEQRTMVADLRAAKGPAFDRAYLDQQLQSHQQALEVQQGYAGNGDAPPLKHAAEQIVPVVQHHIADLQDAQSKMR